MTGIYIITNTVNGHAYVGKSVNIKRRFTEHKTPKSGGNDRLHKDIQTFGISKFEFEVLEECNRYELNVKELQYIKKLNPFYNFVGKPLPKNTRCKISGTLKKYWNGLSDEKKQSIIKNNLKGPPIGHTVSNETKAKIGKRVSEIKKQKVKCIETGEIFASVGAFEKSVGACTGTCAAYWKGKIKSVKGFHVEKCRD